MEFWNSDVETLKKYMVFDGRATRREYWSFVLISVSLTIVASILDTVVLGVSQSSYLGGPIEGVYSIAVLLPSIGVSIRRNHDVGKSGWFVLVPIYNIYLALKPGDKGENSYGPDPHSPKAKKNSKTKNKDDDPLIK